MGAGERNGMINIDKDFFYKLNGEIPKEAFESIEIDNDFGTPSENKPHEPSKSEIYCRKQVTGVNWDNGTVDCYSIENTKEMFNKRGFIALNANIEFDDNADFTAVLCDVSTNDGTYYLQMLSYDAIINQLSNPNVYKRMLPDIKDGDKVKVTVGAFVDLEEDAEITNESRPFLTNKTTVMLPIKMEIITDCENSADIIGEIIGYDDGTARYNNAKCGNCGYEFMDLGGIWESIGESQIVNYCPNCGYKLRKAAKETERGNNGFGSSGR